MNLGRALSSQEPLAPVFRLPLPVPESRTLIVAEPTAGGQALTNTLTQLGGVLNGGVPVEGRISF
jgi:hypothetical protein